MNHLKYLSDDAVRGIAKLVLEGVHREFPYQPGHVVTSAADLRIPRVLHPAFFGCYDWHSAVHSHWTILKLLEHAKTDVNQKRMLETMEAHLSTEAIQIEMAYFREPGRSAFERPYGWAWIWKLTADLRCSPLPEASRWERNIRPLAHLLDQRFASWLDRQIYPCRAGTHANSAFAMAFGLEYAHSCDRPQFADSISAAARRLYGLDRGFSGAMEPSGNDFISPLLTEVCLMGRLLPIEEWRAWFHVLVPSIAELATMKPVEVSDRSDPQGVHLDGLNLSRAYNLASIAGLTEQSTLQQDFRAAAERHWLSGMRHIFSGDFLGEHWLGTFAILAALELAAYSMDCPEGSGR